MPQKRTHIRPGQKLELALTTRERRAILDNLLCLPPEYETQLRKRPAAEPLLLTLDDLDDFSGYVAAESNHTSDKRLRTILDSAFRKMTALLDAFTDEGPPVTRPTKPTKPAKPPNVIVKKFRPAAPRKKAAKKSAKKPAPKKTTSGSRGGWTWAPAKPVPSGMVYQFRITLLGIHPLRAPPRRDARPRRRGVRRTARVGGRKFRPRGF